MRILGIESSCDDTSVALVDCDDNGFVVRSEKTSSQIEIHKKYGGVVPEIAGRKHAEQILPVIEEVMKNQEKPDVIAVTSGPGLMTGLIVGTEAAKALSYLWDIPLIAVNHIEGHIHSVFIGSKSINHNRIRTNEFPALCLIVSGGHTELVLMKNYGEYKLLGKTRDDAAGEVFDKVGKLLGFQYPGGPKISKLAIDGQPKAIAFPRPMLNSDNYDFSFSGLKTSALYWLRDNQYDKDDIPDICASFEQAIVDVLVKKTQKAMHQYNPKTCILGGGVSANKKLRESLRSLVTKKDKVRFLIPELLYTMDNGAMIAVAAYQYALKKKFTDWKNVKAQPNWEVYQSYPS